MESFFDKLGVELEGTPKANIWNYDETNLSGDPGKQRVVMKHMKSRGTKYPGKVCNSSNTSFSVMFVGMQRGR